MSGQVARGFLKQRDGTAALEFAILSPVFLMIVIGGINLALLLFALGSLHYSVEEAARCASVKSTVCSSASAIQSYASGKYFGPAISPVFSTTTTSCGKSVSATASFIWYTGISQLSVPLSATACFP